MKKQKKMRFIFTFALVSALLTSCIAACTDSAAEGVKGGEFSLINGGRAAVIIVEGENKPGVVVDNVEYPGVTRAAYDLQSDIQKITGKKPVVSSRLAGKTDYAVIIGTLGRSSVIDRIAAAGKIDKSLIEGKWECYIAQNVTDPFGDGSVKNALVIAGSDKRGSIYGIYSISELMGMTPWEFFCDSVPAHRDNLVLPVDYISVSEEPDVQYRGIFINDEETLESWARSLDEGKHLGPNLYKKIFEMLLRVKSNYLWPGMHACSDAFSDYIENPVNADYYGIVIGTSHCDMLLRNNINEWSSFVSAYKAEHPEYLKDIVYDYTVNPEIVREYWTQSVRENKDYEVQWTLGMRGAHDEPFTAVNIDKAPWYGDKNMLMEQIIADQRDILRTELNNPTLENVFMMFIPYKEVQTLYNAGLKVPDDVTIMWADDNHGFIRNLPNEEERARSGGLGVYYHNSYWGPDNESYMWVNSMPFTMIYEEMSKAYEYEVSKAWILNAGDMVPFMPEIEFFMDLGMNVSEYSPERVYETYLEKMVTREFGAEYVDDVVKVVKMYTQMTNARKIEQMSVDIFSAAYGDEAERRASMYRELYRLAENINDSLPEEKRDCFYETILFEVRCAYYTNEEFYYAHKGNIAYTQGRASTVNNAYNLSLEYNRMRKDEISYYNNILSGGKWKNLMDPEIYHSPVMAGFASGSPVFAAGAPEMGVVAEGEILEQENSVLSFGNYARGTKYVDVFNKGAGKFSFTASADKDFIIIDKKSGTVSDETRLLISVDWNKITKTETAVVTIASGDVKKEIQVTACFDDFSLPEKTYVEQDGFVSVEAEHYTSAKTTAVAGWRTIKDLGRVSGDMVRAETSTLVGYSERSYRENAPYLEYDVYFTSTGSFETEIYRLPTLNSLGNVRFAVSVNDETPVMIEGEKDYGTNNPAWEEGVFTQIIKHKTTLEIKNAGINKIRIYMVDPFITIDKLVVYTGEKQQSYFGPAESYNSTYNEKPWIKSEYEPAYESGKYELPEKYDIAREYGVGAFAEQNGSIAIEAEAAALGERGSGAWTEGRWLAARTDAGISMRTADIREDFNGRWLSEAPRMSYEIIVSNPGNYKVWVNINAPAPRSSTYAIGLDGVYKFAKSDFNWSREEVFQWRDSGSSLYLSAGKHTFLFFCSQDGLAVDKIYLTKNGDVPADNGMMQSPRTPVYSGNAAASAADAGLRGRLQKAVFSAGNFASAVAGTETGEYGISQLAALREATDAAYDLINSPEALSAAKTESAEKKIAQTLDEFKKSRKMSENGKNYLVYENYDKQLIGFAPYGYTEFGIKLSPDAVVRRDADGDGYFNLRAFKEQANTEKIFAGYEFAAQSGSVTLETVMSFNEAEWGSLYLLNEHGENAVCVAFEYVYGKYNLVAYDGGVKKTVASYTRNVPLEIKIEVSASDNTFCVYAGGELAAEDFAFRNDSMSVDAVMFGSSARDADMRIYEIRVYGE